jgi:L-2-hydroxyglutarate oxidase
VAPAALPPTADFLVIGGGVIGVTLAWELRRRHPDSRVVLLEKEAQCGQHASGRNSGVLHAGFYYTADSLKARFTVEGNRRLTEYCRERALPIRPCGKLVVASRPGDLAGLSELLRRGKANGVRLEELTAEDARRIEPRVRTLERALYSPSTASVDPRVVLAALVEDAQRAGVEIFTGTAYHRRVPGGVRTSAGTISTGYLVNAAGLYADRVARQYGFSQRYQILPFKGLYLEDGPGAPKFRTHIYPVPDLHNPFLGAHVTVTVDGRTTLGPTATPAFWREHYRGIENFRLGESVEIVAREAGLFLRNDFGFRGLALRELRKYNRRHLVRLSSVLADGIRLQDYPRWRAAGIRAQLFDIHQRKLEMDFRYEGDHESFHVLNAVSPAFTCSLPFSAHLADQIDRLAA